MEVGWIRTSMCPSRRWVPPLEREDIAEALRYAAWRAEEREIELSER